MNENAFTDAERAHFRRLKFRAWFSRNRTPAAPRSRAMRPAGPPSLPPLQTRPRLQLFTKETAQEEFWRLVPQLGCRVVVPGGVVLTAVDRAWRREAVGTP